MIILNPTDSRPLYEQITDKLKELIIGGYLKENDKVPSVRELAAELAINPNTIQKAYSELERQGIVYSVPGRGSFVSSDTAAIEKQHREKVTSELEAMIGEAMRAGVSRDEIIEIINRKQEEIKR